MLKTIIKKQCNEGDYFILSVKGGAIPWKDIPFKYKDEAQLNRQLRKFFRDYPMEEYDLYFCPVTYSQPRRRKEQANEIKYLWQDIDENEDITSLEPMPTYLWESSPNKWQGLWEIDRYITPEQAEYLNKNLSLATGSDKCYDVGHVLRIPGTINHKYKDSPEVGEVIDTKKIYRYKTLYKELEAQEGKSSSKEVKSSEGALLSASKIIEKYNIPKKALELLTASEAEGGRRSDVIWYLENKLFEIGMEIPEIICLIKNSVWNKYRGRRDENERLTKEAEKILNKDFEEGGNLSRLKPAKKEFTLNGYGEVMSNLNTFPGWLVEGFWGRRSHGIVAGQPKVFKSTYVHDLAVSVASGKPFLGKYKVVEPGPVIFVQNENADWLMKDRTEKIIAHRGLGGKVSYRDSHTLNITWPENIPLYFINQQGFQLDNVDHQAQFEKMVQDIKPVLVIFDPLYMMFSGNLNAAEELNPVLTWLLELKNKYKTGVLLVHHYNKGTDANRGGQKMLGSVVLHGWVESAWYMRRGDKETINDVTNISPDQQTKNPSSVIMEREFRTAGSYPEIELKIRMGEYMDPYYEVDVDIFTGEEANNRKNEIQDEVIKDYIIQILKASSYPLNKKELIGQFYLSFPDQKVSQRKIKDVIDSMTSSNELKFLPSKGYYI